MFHDTYLCPCPAGGVCAGGLAVGRTGSREARGTLAAPGHGGTGQGARGKSLKANNIHQPNVWVRVDDSAHSLSEYVGQG